MDCEQRLDYCSKKNKTSLSFLFFLPPTLEKLSSSLLTFLITALRVFITLNAKAILLKKPIPDEPKKYLNQYIFRKAYKI